ncbi:transmembrane amino acid transporter family protein [Actinidia rufa]|uniref:Transmembrane amino acid transporter family protein n=1 Tax=Actinidia rufa TaxID=165716 RepID=A0A7J0GI71_9ERIC|nr:transmembrane amino acid transporter family protein [Actinidia rufa]
MSEVMEDGSAVAPPGAAVPVVEAPPMQTQYNSPSLSRKPLLLIQPPNPVTSKTPKSNSRTPNFITPLGSPIRRALKMTKLDPHDAWLPITESRNGNAYYAAFHTLCSGIGIQALLVPIAFTVLGWAWGVISLTVAFFWQLYTLGLLWGGGTMKIFYSVVCGHGCTTKPLTTVEWYLVFTCAAVVLSQLPNLNSIAGVSLIGAITAVGYCTIMWLVSVSEGRLEGVSYDRVRPASNVAWFFGVLNSFGIVAFAFRGHNLTLEIQATMPSSDKKPSHVPMWRGVKIAYIIVAFCLFPVAIGGYWAYGHKIPENGGMLSAIYMYHGRDSSPFILGLTSMFVIINAVSSFQIYAMQMFDDMESKYTKKMNQPCPWWLRVISRAMFGYGCFFVAVAIPFLGSLAGLIGGIALPVTFAYPCFMWLKIRKPKKQSLMWWLNWVLGIAGSILSVLAIAAGLYVVIDTGIKVSFFKP